MEIPSQEHNYYVLFKDNYLIYNSGLFIYLLEIVLNSILSVFLKYIYKEDILSFTFAR